MTDVFDLAVLDPNHPVSREIANHWHKIAALILWKLGRTELHISLEDVRAFGNAQRYVVLHAQDESMAISLVDKEAGERLAAEAGGLPL